MEKCYIEINLHGDRFTSCVGLENGKNYPANGDAKRCRGL
jgi:hypothetical protein